MRQIENFRSRLRIHGVWRSIWLSASLATILPGVAVTSDARATVFTPLEWQSQREGDFDQDQNKIADVLEDPGDTTDKDVIVDLNRCMTPSEIETTFSSFGTIELVDKFISFFTLSGVDPDDLPAIAAIDSVAAIESQPSFTADLGISTRAIRVAPSTTYSPDTSAELGLSGLGAEIAILDTGVDNSHEAFFTRFTAGYDATTNVFIDPDDDDADFHGTHVAGIAMGTGFGSSTCRGAGCAGVALTSGLIDIKVLRSDGSGSFDDVIRGINYAVAFQDQLGIDVLNMSLGCDPLNPNCPTDGFDPLSQAVNNAVYRGMVAVVAAGNGFTAGALGTPASAFRAITVANADDKGTVDRADDDIAASSRWGPNSPFAAVSNRKKPDVAAPGMGIVSAKGNTTDQYHALSGTSMAAPHVAGVAAIILEARPTMPPFSVKDLILRTADRAPSIPGMEANGLVDDPSDLDYDVGSGYGLVNAFAAVESLIPQQTDVKFPSCLPDPVFCRLSANNQSPPPFRNSTDLIIGSPPVAGVPNTITVVVENAGANFAAGVQVEINVYDSAAGIERWYTLATVTVDIPSGQTVSPSIIIPWTPLPGHQCVEARITFGLDSDFANNATQLNVQVAEVASPAVFQFQVENKLLVPTRLELAFICQKTNWGVTVSPPGPMLNHPFNECGIPVTVELDPDSVTPIGGGGGAKVDALMETSIFLGGVGLKAVGGDDNLCDAWLFGTEICDIDGNRLVDEDDLQQMVASLNMAVPAGDPRDADGDGLVTRLDVNKCFSWCDDAPCTNPLAVTLVEFGASLEPDRVLLQWRTESEIENEGFRVHRSLDPVTGFAVVNGFLPATGGPASGASYAFIDDAVDPGTSYYYQLEDIDTSGTSTFHGAGPCTFGSDSECEPLEVFVPVAEPSAEAFCAEQPVRGVGRWDQWLDSWACRRADWKDNEDRRLPGDCRFRRNKESRIWSCGASPGAN